MPSFQTSRAVAHSAARMFDLVADVEKYPEFLPLCKSLRVRRRVEGAEGVEILVAEMSVGYKAISETFTTKVTLDRARLRINVAYIDGPFRFLENVWHFRSAASGSAVDFDIRYEFKSYALGLLMGAMFERAFAKFAEAFERRADLVYGRPPIAAG